MKAVSPADFLAALHPYKCSDHHLTGPITAQQIEGQGSVYHLEGRILHAMAAEYGGPILEIGSDLGISTRYLAAGASLHRGSVAPYVYAYDPLHKWEADADADWAGKIKQVHTAFAKSDLVFSMAFIDGDHRYGSILADYTCASKCVRGPLVFHDTHPDCPFPTNPSNGSEARQVVKDLLDEAKWDLVDIQSPAGLIIAYPLPH